MDIYFLAMKERRVFQQQFNQSRYTKIEELVEEMKSITQIDTQSFPSDITFPTKSNVIMFDNFC